MANNSTNTTMPVSTVPSKVLLFSIVFQLIAMIIGVLGNIAVTIYTIFWDKQKTATSYLVGNLALADLLVCLTFYPVWIIEFILTILNIESDQDLFCKLSRSTMWSLLFASVATLLAITVDRYLYIVKPLKYPLIATKRRVFLAISAIWLTSCCLLIALLVCWKRSDFRLRSFCFINTYIHWFLDVFVCYLPFTLILILNIRILIVAQKQRKRILAETAVHVSTSNGQPANKISAIHGFFLAVKAVKTFSIVVAVFAFCVLTPTVVGLMLYYFNCSESCRQIWYLVFHYELCGINSIVNAFIYGMRHIKYRQAYRDILFKILRCNQPSN
jgi:hypothetical protein